MVLIQYQIHLLPRVLECFILQSYFKALSILHVTVQMKHSHFYCLKWRATLPHLAICE